MQTKTKEKGATSASTLPELSSVRFCYPVDIASEVHPYFSDSTRVRSKKPRAVLDQANQTVNIMVELSGLVHTSYVPLSNVASYNKA